MGRIHRVFLDPNSVKKTNDGAFLGHEFTLVVQVDKPAECQLRWWERTDVPYIERKVNYLERYVEQEGMIPNVWANMTNICPESEIFRPWLDAQKNHGKEDSVTVRIVDIPAIKIPNGGKRYRSLDFRLIVEGSDGTERAVEARQVLNVDGAKGKVQFTIFANDRQVNAGGYVFGDPPMHSPAPKL